MVVAEAQRLDKEGNEGKSVRQQAEKGVVSSKVLSPKIVSLSFRKEKSTRLI